jgi:threonine/homoserine/homoserine lactone efflux protein
MTSFFLAGLVLGFSAGTAPGPLLALVVSETLQHGLRSGIKVALAPVLTDLPIIACTLLLLSRLASMESALALISMAGALFIARLAWGGLRFAAGQGALPVVARPERSLPKAMAVNLLSPHPYLFWFSVGGPIAFRALEHSLLAVLAFAAAFYALLVAAKVAIALLVSRSRGFLRGRAYVLTMRGLGGVLLLLALLLFRDGLLRLFASLAA